MLHLVIALSALSPWFAPVRDGNLSLAKRLLREGREVNELLTAPRWRDLGSIAYHWDLQPEDIRVRIAKQLLPALHSNARVGLSETGNMMIPYRVGTGEMKVDPKLGPGTVMPHDLFLVGGRAAWAIARLLRSEKPIILDGGLTPGEWNERALKIEARVEDFATEAAKPKKPPVPLHRIRGWSAPHIVPAVNGLLALRPLLEPADDGLGLYRLVEIADAIQARDLLSHPEWSRVKEVWDAWECHSASEWRARFARRLLPHLHDTSRVPLNDAADLFLPYRIKTGDLLPSPKRVYRATREFEYSNRLILSFDIVVGQKTISNVKIRYRPAGG